MGNNEKGQLIYSLAERIYPIFRCLTGQGVRDTLEILKEYIGANDGPVLKICGLPSGTQVFDWNVPKEWLINEGYIEDDQGNRIVDIKKNNLHIVGYSVPIDKWVGLEEMMDYIYTQPDQPEVIPYVTSYYKERSGFCMSEIQKQSLKSGKYHMYIDSKLFDGCLNYGEILISGESKEEIFISTYICHPSMANNECSGPALSAELVKYVSSLKDRRYSYRFVYIPETIGAISYLSINDHLDYMKKNVKAGFNLSCVGDDRDYSIVESPYANSLADKVLKNILKYHTNNNYKCFSYLKRGSDERQYCAPGIRLPLVCFCRSKFEEYPEYHTSSDDMDIVSPEGFQGSYEVMTQVISALENNYVYKTKVLCEPQLGKRGLYPTMGQKGSYDYANIIINFLSYADGDNDLIDISDIINVPVKQLLGIIQSLKEKGIIGADCH